MNGDAEHTPTDPGVDIEQTAVDVLAKGLDGSLRSVRTLSRRLGQAESPGQRADIVAGTGVEARTLIAILEDHARLLERLSDRQDRQEITSRELVAVSDRRPTSWWQWALGGVAAMSAAASGVSALSDMPRVALALTVVAAGTAWLTNSPLPRPRPKTPKGLP